MNFVRFVTSFLALVGILTVTPAQAQRSGDPTSSDLAGSWVVVQNSKATDTLRGMSLQPNGDAELKHSSMSFKRRWKFADGVLTISAANDGFAPGPPDSYKVVAFDASKKKLDIRNEILRRDIRLVKSQ